MTWGKASAAPLPVEISVVEAVGGRRAKKAVKAVMTAALRSIRSMKISKAPDASIEVRVVREVRGKARFRLLLEMRSSEPAVQARMSLRLAQARPKRNQAKRVLVELQRRFNKQRRKAAVALLKAEADTEDPVDLTSEPPSTEQPIETPTEDTPSAESWNEGDWAEVDDWDDAADTAEQAGSLSSAASSVKTQVDVSLVVHHYRYLDQGEDNAVPAKPAGRDSVELQVASKASHEDASVYSQISVRRDLSAPERDRVDFVEGYVSFERDAFSLQAGYMIEAWGTATMFNPTDLLNPVDLRDPLAPETLGTWMLRAGWLKGPLSLTAYYLPVPAAHVTPQVLGVAQDGTLAGTSRWVNGSLAEPGDTDTRFLAGVPVPLETSRSNTQGALRVALATSKTDFAFSYAYLFDRFAAPVPVVLNPGPPATTRVDFLRDRLHALTAEAEQVMGKLRLAGEVVAIFPKKREAIAPMESTKGASYLMAVLSTDYQSAQFFDEQQLHVFVDLAITQGLSESLSDSTFSHFRFPFRRTALLRVDYTMSEDMSLKLDAASALDRYDVLLRPSFSYRFSDLVKATVQANWLAGSGTGFFGLNKDNSRVGLQLEAKY